MTPWLTDPPPRSTKTTTGVYSCQLTKLDELKNTDLRFPTIQSLGREKNPCLILLSESAPRRDDISTIARVVRVYGTF